MKRMIFLVIIFFSSINFSWAQNIIVCPASISAEIQSDTRDLSGKILFTYFNTWPHLATLTYLTTIEGETVVTVGTTTQKTKIKTEIRENFWIKKLNDPKWIFEVFSVIIDCAIAVNGNTTHIP